MKLKNYCLIAFVKQKAIQSIKDDLLELANTPPRYVSTEEYLLASFSSTFEAVEIKNYINQISGRIFFIYECNEASSASNLPPGIEKHLFGNIDMKTNVNLSFTTVGAEKEEGSPEMQVATGNTESVTVDVDSLSASERMEMINDLFDKGLENLNDEDRKLLDILSRKT